MSTPKAHSLRAGAGRYMCMRKRKGYLLAWSAPPGVCMMSRSGTASFLADWHAGDMYPEELHLVTMVDNTTGAPVPPECNERLCLAVFGVMMK